MTGPSSPDAAAQAAPPVPWISESSVWQEVESGSYRIDLPEWERLADGTDSPVLDLGCGTGRVARHLAEAGHTVVGVERDPGIAADYERLSPGPRATVVVADALHLAADPPPPGKFGLVVAPQQLVQTVGGAELRHLLIDGIAALLEPGAVAAFAFTPDLPQRSTELDLLPDLREISGWVYSSQPVSIEATADRVEVTRVRKRVSPAGELQETTVVIAFDRLEAEQLERELDEAGLSPREVIPLPATAEHVASLILVAVRSRR